MSTFLMTDPELVPIDSVKPAMRNPRRGHVEAIRTSLRRNGQYVPIVVRLTGSRIIAGNHTWKACKEEGWEHIAVTWLDVSEQEAGTILLADNRLNDIATYDTDALARILEELMESGDLEGTGFTADELDDFLEELAKLPITEREEFGGDYAETDEELAARAAKYGAGKAMREFVLALREEDYDTFVGNVERCAKAYGVTSKAEAVFLAVMDEAKGEEKG